MQPEGFIILMVFCMLLILFLLREKSIAPIIHKNERDNIILSYHECIWGFRMAFLVVFGVLLAEMISYQHFPRIYYYVPALWEMNKNILFPAALLMSSDIYCFTRKIGPYSRMKSGGGVNASETV